MLISVQTPGTRVKLRRHSLQIHPPEDTGGNDVFVPIEEIDRLVVTTGVSCSTRALARLLGESIPIAFVSQGGKYLGSFEPPSPPRGLTRALQYHQNADPVFRIEIARVLVVAKIANARRALQRLNNRRPTFDPAVLTSLKHVESQAHRATTEDELRGCEGAAAARYFALWAMFLPPAFPFERRSTRPPLNPVNAVISYLSTLVYGDLLSACLSRGIDPAPSCLHVTTDDRYGLPLDLMEPFRPALVEPLTLRFFTLRILNHSHFRPHGKGVYLNDQGRLLLWEHFDQRMSTPFHSTYSGHRTTFRQLLADAPLAFKTALADPSRFNPFRLQ